MLRRPKATKHMHIRSMEDGLDHYPLMVKPAFLTGVIEVRAGHDYAGPQSTSGDGRQNGLPVADTEDGNERDRLGVEDALSVGRWDEEGLKDEEIKKLKGSQGGHPSVDRMVQHRTAPSVSGLQEPPGISR